jgi:hypothetical protein
MILSGARLSRFFPAAVVCTLAGALLTMSAPSMAASGNVTLDWTPPTLNSDGSVFTDLAGYYLQFGRTPYQLTQAIKLTNPGLTSYVVENLAAGTWYFTISSITSNGIQSFESAVVSTTIR